MRVKMRTAKRWIGHLNSSRVLMVSYESIKTSFGGSPSWAGQSHARIVDETQRSELCYEYKMLETKLFLRLSLTRAKNSGRGESSCRSWRI